MMSLFVDIGGSSNWQAVLIVWTHAQVGMTSWVGIQVMGHSIDSFSLSASAEIK